MSKKFKTLKKTTRIKEGDIFEVRNCRFAIEITKCVGRDRYADATDGEYMTEFYYTNIYYTDTMNLVASNVILTYFGMCDEKLYKYLPVDQNFPFVFGDVPDVTYEYKREVALWKSMLNCCYNPTSEEFKYVGALGTKVCDRWKTFEYFLIDLKHMMNYDEYEAFPKERFILELYTHQKNMPPHERMYTRGWVTLVRYKDSDICMYKDRNNHLPYNIYLQNYLLMNETYLTQFVNFCTGYLRYETPIRFPFPYNTNINPPVFNIECIQHPVYESTEKPIVEMCKVIHNT